MGASQCKDDMRERRGQKAEGKGGMLLRGCEPGRKENGRAGLAKDEGEMIILCNCREARRQYVDQ